MEHQEKRSIWLTDQITKSEFFRQKLHEYGLLEIAYAIESIEGEKLSWSHQTLGISEAAWNKIIHRGIKPIIVFAHPYVLTTIKRSVSYYRSLAMVSLKSMQNVQLSLERFEREENPASFTDEKALSVAHHLNQLISRLIEVDDEISPRMFDLWRGMTAGSTAQGSWQNKKGEIAENLIKDFIKRRVDEEKLLLKIADNKTTMVLKNNRCIRYGSEPDIAIYDADQKIVSALEIKGGIDKAGILERVGAAIKSLSRAKQENPEAITILIMHAVSITPQSQQDLEAHKNDIDHWFTIEDIINHESTRQKLFTLLKI